MATLFTTRKSAPERDPRCAHIDEWERASNDTRDKLYGDNFFDEVEEFYNLTDNGGPSPTFRPQLQIPELQTLMLNEANDLSDPSPQVYIMERSAGDRDQDREKAFQAAWAEAQTNFHIMMAQIWSLFCGTGWLQGGYNPNARNGQGQFWWRSRHPKTVFVDPGTTYEMEPAYIGWYDWLYIEQIRQNWPTTGHLVRPMQKSASTGGYEGGSYGFQMPQGPMSTVGGINRPKGNSISQDNRLRVRYTLCNDYTLEAVDDKSIPDGALTRATQRWKYPNGRMVVDCEGVVLADGDNPFPMREFSLIPYWATPPITSVFAVPATRFSQGMQFVAQRLFTGVFENAVRLNNGVWFIDERTGLNAETFGGLPGEVQVINSGSQPPVCVWPGAMPQHFITVPTMLLDIQRRLQGFTPARQGMPGDGNISTDLFDESVLKAQGLTQLRGRMAAISTTRAAKLMFYTMARYQRRMKFPYSDPQGGFSLVDWTSIARPDQYDLYLDPASLKPMSSAVIRRMVPELVAQGLIPRSRALQLLEFPHADDMANEMTLQTALAALANAKRGKR